MMEGVTWSATVLGPVIHSTVPSAISPANLSMRGASAAMSTGRPRGPGVVSPRWALRVSPWNDAFSPRTSGRRIDRYSRMCRAGLSKL
ncbi:hypothetical protein GCM10010517_10390 [Streptosporangium fragile]|uniref:Uncharacterized protein n=1 Tax=Streptosporangium fragile TaxID=46186 RepID=A0ABP6I9M3_9ACTN